MANSKLESAKTNMELNAMLMAEWIGVLQKMWHAIGKAVDRNQLDVYAEQLADVPMGVLEDAVSQAIRDNKYNTVPSIGTIWKNIRGTDVHPLTVQDRLNSHLQNKYRSNREKE